MRFRFALLLITLLPLLLPHSAKACSCASLTPCEAFGYASAVFVGRMLEGTEKVREYTKDGKTISYEAGKVRFTVEEAFKGVTSTEITIFVLNLKGTSCEGTALGRGERYLVYAGYMDSVGLSVGPCSPTRTIAEAKADLDYLRALPQPGVGGRLYGRVGVETGHGEPTPLPDVTVTVEDEKHQRWETKTDRNGNYEVNGLPPGQYVANPTLPRNYIFRDGHQPNREVVVSDRACSSASFWVNVDGGVSGSVTDSLGHSAPADLELISTKGGHMFFGHSDADGEYEIGGVPPGKYLLQIDFIKGEDEETPYYYPGTKDKTKATVITIGMGEKVSGKNFQLPENLRVLTVQGVVKYADGRPVGGAEVRLIPNRNNQSVAYRARDYTDTLTDEAGHFTLRGYKDVSYDVLVFDDLMKAIAEKRLAGRASVTNILLQKDVEGISVVLPLEPNPNAAKAPSQKQP